MDNIELLLIYLTDNGCPRLSPFFGVIYASYNKNLSLFFIIFLHSIWFS